MSESNQWQIKCPHCGAHSVVRDSQQLTETVREARVQCKNVECAHTWIAHIAAVRTLAPSMTPNPKVYIPLSTRTQAANASAANNQMDLGMDYPLPRMAPSG